MGAIAGVHPRRTAAEEGAAEGSPQRRRCTAGAANMQQLLPGRGGWPCFIHDSVGGGAHSHQPSPWKGERGVWAGESVCIQSEAEFASQSFFPHDLAARPSVSAADVDTLFSSTTTKLRPINAGAACQSHSQASRHKKTAPHPSIGHRQPELQLELRGCVRRANQARSSAALHTPRGTGWLVAAGAAYTQLRPPRGREGEVRAGAGTTPILGLASSV